MNWSEDLKKDIYLFRFSELVLQECSLGLKKQSKNPLFNQEETLASFCKVLLGTDTLKINS